ncbi:unnamed protein product [Rotaria sp. Silwood2]|nr:unnamed protein product [Rotaria sp. Silwood2]CAF4096642.1 unnamed protein product [Rotaria sp. Silwood2]
MLAHSPRDRSRSPHSTDGTSSVKQMHHSNQNDPSSQIESTDNSKVKKENESQQRIKNLKSFIQTLINESTSIGSTYDEQMKTLENACIEEYRDLSVDRIRRMIRSALKLRKTQPSSSTNSHTPSPFLHKDHSKALSITNERFNSNENNSKKNRSNSLSNNPTTTTTTTTTTPDLVSSSTLSALDADFLRHAFSQQFRPSLDLSAYFSAATPSNGTSSTSSLFRPNFSPSTFLQSLTNTTSLAPPLAPPPPPTFVSSHTHTNGTSDSSSVKSSKQMKLSNTEATSIKVLVNAYREAASYLCRSADELEQLL